MQFTEGKAALVGDREISITRTFDAPRELVFKLFTDHAHLAHWWGPDGFKLTTHKMDLRVGGQWDFVMHGPDGRDYHNLVTYLEIDPPYRLVFKHGGHDNVEPVNHTTTAVFEEPFPGKTRLTFSATFTDAAARDFVIKTYGALDGCTQTIGRLGAYVASGAVKPAKPFVLTREFDAPLSRVYSAWTQAEHLGNWFGPAGTEIGTCELDLRPGGMFLYEMRTPTGSMWGRWIFREIHLDAKLVFVVSFSDPEGGITRHPLSDKWPRETLSTVTFEPRGNRTLVRVEWEPVNATPEERAMFDASHESMTMGWGGTMDALEKYLG